MLFLILGATVSTVLDLTCDEIIVDHFPGVEPESNIDVVLVSF